MANLAIHWIDANSELRSDDEVDRRTETMDTFGTHVLVGFKLRPSPLVTVTAREHAPYPHLSVLWTPAHRQNTLPKTKKPDPFGTGHSTLAETVGFEPTVHLRRQHLSRVPHSAALARLR